jgi:BirA family biotin operon repressor/biotin-[acetyl-CoA-carboxylase] ligase
MVAVIGIGINLAPPAADLGLDVPASSLLEVLPALPDRHALLAQILCELAPALDQFSQTGFAAFRSEWQGLHAWQNQAVSVLRDGQVEMAGICRGADADGALLVETATGLTRGLSGDVSLRQAAP